VSHKTLIRHDSDKLARLIVNLWQRADKINFQEF